MTNHFESTTEATPQWAQFELLVAHLTDGVTVQDATGKLVYANYAGAKLSGYQSPAELLQAPVGDYQKRFEVLTPSGQPIPMQSLPGRLALQGETTTAELLVRDRQNGTERWSEVRSYPVHDPNGGVLFVVNIFRDTTESAYQRRLLEDQAQELEEQAVQAQALAEELEQSNEDLAESLRILELSRHREEYLSKATAILGSSLDYAATLAQVATLAVPELADWCSVDVVGPNGDVQQVAVAHVDQAKVKWARELRAQSPPDMNAQSGLPKVLRTGEPEWFPDVSDDLLARTARSAEELEILRAIGFSSAIIVPIRAGATVGAMTLVWAESGKHYEKPDLEFATELGRRAGMAVERATLYRDAIQARGEAEAAYAVSEERARWLSKLQQLAISLSRTQTPDEVRVVATTAACDAFEADAAYLGLLDASRSFLDLVDVSGLPEEIARQIQRLPIDAEVPSTACVRLAEPVLIESAASFGERFPAIDWLRRDTGIRAAAAFPVRVAGTVIGSLAFSYKEERAFDHDFVTAGRTFAKEIGQAWDRARSREELVVAKAAAESAAAAKSAFLSTVSHELRTPINAILGFSELLRSEVAGPTTEVQAGYLTRIRHSTDHLLDLINDILDLAKIESDQLDISPRRSSAAKVVREAVEVIDGDAEARGLRLDWSCADGVTYVGDPRRVRQILLNLLSNAMKFTPRGGEVRIAGAAQPGSAGVSAVTFTVEDTGIGIKPGDLTRIFEAFAQGEEAYTRVHGGTGLGLTISRRLARLMGGDVSVVSNEGQGSVFTLTLPG